jgi:hypothetical protein
MSSCTSTRRCEDCAVFGKETYDMRYNCETDVHSMSSCVLIIGFIRWTLWGIRSIKRYEHAGNMSPCSNNKTLQTLGHVSGMFLFEGHVLFQLNTVEACPCLENRNVGLSSPTCTFRQLMTRGTCLCSVERLFAEDESLSMTLKNISFLLLLPVSNTLKKVFLHIIYFACLWGIHTCLM